MSRALYLLAAALLLAGLGQIAFAIAMIARLP